MLVSYRVAQIITRIVQCQVQVKFSKDRCNDRRRQPLQLIKSFRLIRLNSGDRRLGNDALTEAT